ncbi:MAG: tetratricopeptide repeat protein [Candidatus Obscuribacterales bacterium]|nr:tetratricopeptide repeat protein [Candidatus Obscuribacterales bacterium]
MRLTSLAMISALYPYATAFGATPVAGSKKPPVMTESSAYSINDMEGLHNQILKEFSKPSYTEQQLQRLKERLIEQLGAQKSAFEKAQKLSKQADELFIKKNYAEAVKVLTEILLIENLGLQEPFLLKRGECYEEMGEIDSAITDYKEGLGLSTAYKSMFRSHLSRILIKKGELQEALSQLNASIDEEKKGFLAPYGARGDLYVKLKEYDKALDDYNQAIDNYQSYYKEEGVKVDGDNIERSKTSNLAFVLQDRGELYMLLGKYDLAVADFNKAEKYILDILKDKVLISLIKAYEKSGAKEKAREKRESFLASHNEKIKSEPSSRTYHDRGLVYLDLDMPQEAISDFGEAIKSKPKDAHNYYHLARALIKQKDYQKAIENLSKAISLAPKDADYYYHRANTFLRIDKFEKALLDIGKSIELEPKDGRFYKVKSRILFKLGRDLEAEKALEQATLLGDSGRDDLP